MYTCMYYIKGCTFLATTPCTLHWHAVNIIKTCGYFRDRFNNGYY